MCDVQLLSLLCVYWIVYVIFVAHQLIFVTYLCFTLIDVKCYTNKDIIIFMYNSPMRYIEDIFLYFLQFVFRFSQRKTCNTLTCLCLLVWFGIQTLLGGHMWPLQLPQPFPFRISLKHTQPPIPNTTISKHTHTHPLIQLLRHSFQTMLNL